MADDAGFAVALTIREQLLKSALLIAYAGRSFPRALDTAQFPGGLLPGGPPDAGLNVYLGPPQINTHADNTLTLDIEMWGQLTVTMSSTAEAANIDGHLTAAIQPVFEVSGTNLLLSATQSVVTVTQWDFTLIPPSSFSPVAETYLRSSAFRNRLQTTVQQAISFGVVSLPAIDISFLHSLTTAVEMTATSRVQQGAVLIGLSIDSADLMLVGNVDALADFARDNDLAAAINAPAVPTLLQDVQTKVNDEIAKNGATLQQPLTITPGPGKFLISGSASKSTGSATFSFSLVPTLFASKPGTLFQYLSKPLYVKPRTWPALGFATADVNVNVDPAAWVVVLGVIGTVLNLGVPIIIAGIASSTAAQLTSSIQGASTIAPIPRVQRLKPTDRASATVRIELAEYEITTTGNYIGIKVTPQAPPGALIGLTSIPADFGSMSLSYSVRLPLGISTDDPALRIRWTIIDVASGNVLSSEDEIAAGRDTFAFVPGSVAPGSAQLRITVRVYRTLGPEITDFLNDGITLQIRGPLPRGAYVRWYYDVKNPQVGFDDNRDTWTYTGEAVVKRHSNIHRTDKPCAMEAKRSRYTYRVDVLDALPFSVANLAAHRSELCDYCFYGGPAGIRPAL